MITNHTNYSIKANPIFNQDSQFKRPLGFFKKDELLISAKGIAPIYSRVEVAPKFADANFEKENQSLVFNKELPSWEVGGGTESISPAGLEFVSAPIRESVQEKCSQMNIPYLIAEPVIQKKSNFF